MTSTPKIKHDRLLMSIKIAAFYEIKLLQELPKEGKENQKERQQIGVPEGREEKNRLPAFHSLGVAVDSQ